MKIDDFFEKERLESLGWRVTVVTFSQEQCWSCYEPGGWTIFVPLGALTEAYGRVVLGRMIFGPYDA